MRAFVQMSALDPAPDVLVAFASRPGVTHGVAEALADWAEPAEAR